jgi:hypothetical protein
MISLTPLEYALLCNRADEAVRERLALRERVVVRPSVLVLPDRLEIKAVLRKGNYNTFLHCILTLRALAEAGGEGTLVQRLTAARIVSLLDRHAVETRLDLAEKRAPRLGTPPVEASVVPKRGLLSKITGALK